QGIVDEIPSCVIIGVIEKCRPSGNIVDPERLRSVVGKSVRWTAVCVCCYSGAAYPVTQTIHDRSTSEGRIFKAGNQCLRLGRNGHGTQASGGKERASQRMEGQGRGMGRRFHGMDEAWG